MLLKKLTVQGYKTFANKTEFIFDEGITSIVGPNGSGKSNVADAVRWVLGEQSISELRGKRTVDMIFAGSPSRPRAGMASAVLTLDNSGGWLPIDYAEVEIGRRAYRTGENEYYLNGSKVRLRDVRELLATSGLAQRTYTMIGQGLVDRALSLKSEERRALFEEAAGISHYKTRRAETLRRLQETQRNIQRVQDILAEIEPRLRSLKRQANKTQNYEQVKVDLQDLLRTWYGYQWKAAKTGLRDARAKSAESEARWKEARRQLIFFQEQMEESRKRLNHYQNQLNEKNTQREGLREQLEHARRQVAILTERQSLVTRQLAEIEIDLPDLEAQQASAQAELNQSTGELAQVQAQLESERSELATFEKSFQEKQSQIETQQKKVQRLDLDFQAAQRKVSQSEGQLEQLKERLAERQGQSFDSAELERTQTDIASFETQIADLRKENDALREQRQALRSQREASIRDLKQKRKDQHKLAQTVSTLNKQVAKLEARVDLLDQMRQKATKVSGSAEVVGRITSLLTIPAAHQPAIEAALGARLSALIVPDVANLTQLLNDNADGALSVLIADAATPQQTVSASAGVCASTVVKYKKKDAKLVETLLNPVLLVDDVEMGLKMAKSLAGGEVAVSADAITIYPTGIVERPATSNADNLLARENEWRAAAASVAEQQLALTTSQDATSAAQAAIDAAQAETNKLNFADQDVVTQQQKVQQQLSALQRDLDRRKQHVEFLQRQQSSQSQDVERLQARIAELEAAMGSGNEQIITLQSARDAARVTLEALPIGEVKQQRGNFQQQIAATQTIVSGRRAVVDSRRATLGQVENRLLRQRQRQQSLHNQQQEIDLPKEESSLNQLQTRMRTLDDDIAPLRSLRSKVQGELSDIEADALTHQKEAHVQEEAYTEARLNLNQQQGSIDNLRERIENDLGVVDLSYDEADTVQTPLPMDDVVGTLPDVEMLPDGISESIRKRRAQMQNMGAINPDAPEEYRTTLERYEFLSEQIVDLNETEGQLRTVIADLDKLTSEEFAKTVARVNIVFGEMFTNLFGGGSAELVLTDPDDLTVSGVDILAQLPRRRVQGLGLLSGGERSLTAAALIFALLKVTPPPFCVMDEVDAALDEANINRFRDALRDLSLNTQFIVITHNRGTVQAANTIYGISMGGDSASQVISIKPEDYVQTEIFE